MPVASNTDSYVLSSPLTAPRLIARAGALLPEHGERLLPPTETLSKLAAQILWAVGPIAVPSRVGVPCESERTLPLQFLHPRLR
jgi:hypothetical protein